MISMCCCFFTNSYSTNTGLNTNTSCKTKISCSFNTKSNCNTRSNTNISCSFDTRSNYNTTRSNTNRSNYNTARSNTNRSNTNRSNTNRSNTNRSNTKCFFSKVKYYSSNCCFYTIDNFCRIFLSSLRMFAHVNPVSHDRSPCKVNCIS